MSRELAERYVAPTRNQDAGALGELFADDAVLYHPLSPEPIQGKEAIVASEQGPFDAFSEIDVEVRRVVTDEESVVLEVVMRATNTGPLEVGAEEPLPATGRRIELPRSGG